MWLGGLVTAWLVCGFPRAWDAPVLLSSDCGVGLVHLGGLTGAPLCLVAGSLLPNICGTAGYPNTLLT